jgi:type IV pilus assembly protein PilC
MIYTYEASDQYGKIVEGEYDAHDRDGVVEYLTRKELIPISIREKGLATGEQKKNIVLFETITAVDRILLVRNLAATIRSGLNIIEALNILIGDTTKELMRAILNDAKNNLKSGQPLSATFMTYHKYFPTIFVGMIKAGEASGRLEETLNELGKHLSREYNLLRKVRSALAYPIILLVASIGVIALMLIFVLPRLVKVFKQSNAPLPLPTQILMTVSNAVTYSITLDIVVIGALVWFFVAFRKTPRGQRLFMWAFMRTPFVRELVHKVALVRLTRTLGSLIGSGTHIIEALELAADSVGNIYYKNAIVASVEQIKNGVPLSKALEHYPDLFPHFLIGLVAVGERTGTLQHVMETFADFYDEEVDHTLKDLTTFLEPMLLLMMGLVIGTIALSILLPIYRLVGKFV